MDDRHLYSLMWLNLSWGFFTFRYIQAVVNSIASLCMESVSYIQHIGAKRLTCIPNFTLNLHSALCLNDNIAVGKQPKDVSGYTIK